MTFANGNGSTDCRNRSEACWPVSTMRQKAERIRQWKDEEARRRNLWHFVRKNSEAITGVKAPVALRYRVGPQAGAGLRPDSPYRTDEPKRTV